MSEEGFLSRWSRRKRAAEAGRPVEEAAQAAPPVPAAVPVPVAMPVAVPMPAPAEPAEPEFDVASLPPVESLTIESDITAFLRKGVPEALKRAALRRAWSVDPAIRDFVGPADYAWDFNAPDGVPGFSLELGGDVQKLLAQAMGLDRQEPPAEARKPRADDPPIDPHARVECEQPLPQAPVPALAEAPAPPAPEAPETALPVARRHGSALPI